MTVPFARLSEACDPLILSVTRDLLHRSEKVALHRMMRKGVQLPVMPLGVGRVALIARSVGRVRVTRPMARHIRQSVTAVAMHAMARMTSAVATAITVATAIAADVSIVSRGVAVTTAAAAPATTVTEDTDGRVAVTATASAVATGVTIPAAPTESASRSRTGGRNCETHAEDCYR